MSATAESVEHLTRSVWALKGTDQILFTWIDLYKLNLYLVGKGDLKPHTMGLPVEFYSVVTSLAVC